MKGAAGVASGLIPQHRWGTAPDFVGPRHAFRERLLMSLLVAARPGPRVLNIGAGQGSFSRLLEQRGFSVTSTDISESAVRVLRARVDGDVQLADVCDLPFADSSFDAAVLGEVLEHVRDDHAALVEVRRALEPGGFAVISVPSAAIPFGPADAWAGHLRKYTRAGLVELCRRADFRVVRCTSWGFPVAAAYHRYVYEPRLVRNGEHGAARAPRAAHLALSLLLQVDRLFVGVERGALGHLALLQR